jgi:hypothetical protein
MHRIRSIWGVLPTVRLHYIRNGTGRVLVAVGLMLGTAGHAPAQPDDIACGSYRALCQARPNAGMCAKIQQKCGSAAGGTASIQPHGAKGRAMPQLDSPTDVPDCTKDQELVMVPTCQCGSPLDAGGSADSACASCTTDGVRMECQEAR